MLKFLLSISLVLFSATVSHAQLARQWDYRFGGQNQEWLFAFKQTTDSGYILGGASTSSVSGDKTQLSRGDWDFWIIKLDPSGIKQWDKRFGGLREDDLYALSQT